MVPSGALASRLETPCGAEGFSPCGAEGFRAWGVGLQGFGEGFGDVQREVCFFPPRAAGVEVYDMGFVFLDYRSLLAMRGLCMRIHLFAVT